jgi:hypothetical protein
VTGLGCRFGWRIAPPVAVARTCVAALCLALGCATPGTTGGRSFDFFSTVATGSSDDDWYPKVAEWQARAAREGTRLPRTERISLRSAERSGQLLDTMAAYRDEQRREFARAVNDWAHRLARRHYRWDPGNDDPTWDHWPTVGELLATNGDDCDGLDLIAYQMLREFGFPRDQLYRAILGRDRDGANHMVTLWFENASDPWVLDATGAVAVEFHRLSELPGWTPTKLFNESIQYEVTERERARTIAGAD